MGWNRLKWPVILFEGERGFLVPVCISEKGIDNIGRNPIDYLTHHHLWMNLTPKQHELKEHAKEEQAEYDKPIIEAEHI